MTEPAAGARRSTGRTVAGRGAPSLATLLALLAAGGLALACRAAAPDLDARRESILQHAVATVKATLEDAVARARRAVAGVDAALDRAGDDRIRRFEALERVRAEADVDGIDVADPGGTPLWAGLPVEEAEGVDPRAPWAGSFEAGDLHFHAGPFLRALILTGPMSRGQVARATVRLQEPGSHPGPYAGTIEERWAANLHARRVSILPPAVLERPAGPAVRRASVASPSGTPLLAVEVEAPSDEVIAGIALQEERRSSGWLGLAGVAIAALAAASAIRRWVPAPAARWVGLALVALAARHGLRVLDLKERFSEWAPAFRSTDFGVSGYAGWLSSPGELFLTTIALLLASVGVSRASGGLRERRTPFCRCAALACGLLLVLVGVRLWLFLVEAAQDHGQIDFLAAGTLVPSLPRALLLSGLVATTAASWVLSRAGLRLVISALPLVPAALAAALAAAGAGLLAGRLAETTLPAWAPFLVPLAAALVGRLKPGEARPGAPSRILLVSILSTLLLFPALWKGAERSARLELETRVLELVRGPSSLATVMRVWLSGLPEDTELVGALAAHAAALKSAAPGGGGAPEGLALHVWRRLHFDVATENEGVVYVYDAHAARLERFALNAPPFQRLPDPRPDPEFDADPIAIVTIAPAQDRVGATVGRVRLRGPDGTVAGTVAVVVPDALTVELAGVMPRLAPRPPEASEADRRGERLELSLVKDGLVAMSTDPGAPRGLPPEFDVASVREPGWISAEDGARPVFAVPAGERGVVLARGPARDFESALYGLARLFSVGVGLGAVLALLALLASVRLLRPRLQDKILLSYFVVSVVPLVFLAAANFRDAMRRAEEDFRERLGAVARSSRSEIERTIGEDIDYLVRSLSIYSEQRGQDVGLYVDGDVRASSLNSLIDAELLPTRLDASVYLATELEGRDLEIRQEHVGGRPVQVAYTPLRKSNGTRFATLAVPLLFDSDRAEQRASETGSVLLAAYLLTLVLVLVIGIYVARSLARPLERLSEAVKDVAAGHLDVAIPGAGTDETGRLVAGFNEMTQDLKRAREQAARAERETAWRGMARQVAHEIKNPLTPMKLMLQQLQATGRSEPERLPELLGPTVQVTLEQIDALARIASDFAAFARFPPRNVSDVDLGEVLRSVATLYGTGDAGEEQVSTRLEDGLPPVRWDRDELRRVFLNLVANAVQAKDPEKGRVRVEIRATRAKVPSSGRDGVLVTVTDDGVGIRPEDRVRLFEPDFSTKTHGTGLGLAIVKRILADLSGEIRIDSTPGQGTTVSTWIPASGEVIPGETGGR